MIRQHPLSWPPGRERTLWHHVRRASFADITIPAAAEQGEEQMTERNIQMDTKVPCNRCAGSGLVQLALELQQTLALLSTTPRTTEELRASLEPVPTPTALCKRMTALEELGLARRVGKRGKAVLWVSMDERGLGGVLA